MRPSVRLPTLVRAHPDLRLQGSGSIARGFYGATYQGTRGRLGLRFVLKVVPIEVYRFFGKDFQHECQVHGEVSEGTDHLNDIVDFFDATLTFGDSTLDCHIAVLAYIDGVTLDRVLGERDVSARRLAQLAIDLFRLLQELENKGKYHNDLHERNLIVQILGADRRRAEAINDEARLVAVDLGSIDDASRSGPARPALGDLAAVAQHPLGFAQGLPERPDDVPDIDYQLACTLEELAHALGGAATNIRTPDYADFIAQIWDSHTQISSPWKPPPGLRPLNDSYNAQTLPRWFVPRLLVDPRGEWIAAISTKGPQVITGMRGCGKTMLLRALQSHSRLMEHQERGVARAAASGISLPPTVTSDSTSHAPGCSTGWATPQRNFTSHTRGCSSRTPARVSAPYVICGRSSPMLPHWGGGGSSPRVSQRRSARPTVSVT